MLSWDKEKLDFNAVLFQVLDGFFLEKQMERKLMECDITDCK